MKSPALAAPCDEFFCRLEMVRTRAVVLRDSEAIERLHAPEYELITPAGCVFTRERHLGLLAGAPFYADWT